MYISENQNQLKFLQIFSIIKSNIIKFIRQNNVKFESAHFDYIIKKILE